MEFLLGWDVKIFIHLAINVWVVIHQTFCTTIQKKPFCWIIVDLFVVQFNERNNLHDSPVNISAPRKGDSADMRVSYSNRFPFMSFPFAVNFKQHYVYGLQYPV